MWVLANFLLKCSLLYFGCKERGRSEVRGCEAGHRGHDAGHWLGSDYSGKGHHVPGHGKGDIQIICGDFGVSDVGVVEVLHL